MNDAHFEKMIRDIWRHSSERSLVRKLVYATLGERTPEFTKFRGGRPEPIDPRAVPVLAAIARERWPEGVPGDVLRKHCPELARRFQRAVSS